MGLLCVALACAAPAAAKAPAPTRGDLEPGDACRTSERGRGRPKSFAEEQILSGRVVRIIDGDTIDVLDDSKTPRRIRLAGIDTPERGKPFFKRASQHLAGLVHGKDVEVRWQKIDPFNRCVGKVWVADPTCATAPCPKSLDANLAQIQAGFAWWYRRYAREQSPEDRATYEAAEQRAREARLGLWVDPDPAPPWKGRTQKRQKKRERGEARPPAEGPAVKVLGAEAPAAASAP